MQGEGADRPLKRKRANLHVFCHIKTLSPSIVKCLQSKGVHRDSSGP